MEINILSQNNKKRLSGLWSAAAALYINSDMLLSVSSDTENKDWLVFLSTVKEWLWIFGKYAYHTSFSNSKSEKVSFSAKQKDERMIHQNI